MLGLRLLDPYILMCGRDPAQEPILELLRKHVDSKGKQAKLKSPAELQVRFTFTCLGADTQAFPFTTFGTVTHVGAIGSHAFCRSSLLRRMELI